MDVQTQAYDFNVRFFSLGCCPLRFVKFFVSKVRPSVHRAVWLVFIIPGAFNYPRSTRYLLPGLVDYLISKMCLIVVSASTSPVWYFSPFAWANPVPWGFIEPLSKRAMGLNDQSLFIPLPELLCQPHHLVGIIQSRVWLSCFTGYFSHGLISTVSIWRVGDYYFGFYISFYSLPNPILGVHWSSLYCLGSILCC